MRGSRLKNIQRYTLVNYFITLCYYVKMIDNLRARPYAIGLTFLIINASKTTKATKLQFTNTLNGSKVVFFQQQIIEREDPFNNGSCNKNNILPESNMYRKFANASVYTNKVITLDHFRITLQFPQTIT